MGILRLRRAALSKDDDGHAEWRQILEERPIRPEASAIIICDMWDRHWSRGASERVDAMAPRMNGVIQKARSAGAQIIHAPSDTLAFYADHPARRRMVAVPRSTPPAERLHVDPPLPIDDSDEGSDTGEAEPSRVWTRQHPALEIDPARDLISDSGLEIYAALQQAKIEQVLIMGVHTNMCVLNRSFGIKQMVRWGVPIALVSDLTDAMYNPAMRPYVSHAEGTRLVISYIAKFWCPILTSHELEAALGQGLTDR
jgi:nicotinamidase-related amidase